MQELVIGIEIIVYVIMGVVFPSNSGLREDILFQNCSSFNSLRISTSESGRVFLETPIVFYEEKYWSVIINSVGIISFENEYKGRYPKSNPGLTSSQLNFSLLTPLWSNLAQDDSHKFSCYWNITDTTTIEQYNELLQLEEGFTEFIPKLLVVATWSNVQVNYGVRLVNGKITQLNENTSFAVILATDGELSFSQFLYDSILQLTDYVVGFTAGDGRSLELHRGKGSLSLEREQLFRVAYRIDGNCISPAYSACNITSFPASCTPFPNITASCNCSKGFGNINLEDDSCQDLTTTVEVSQELSTELMATAGVTLDVSTSAPLEAISSALIAGITIPIVILVAILGVIIVGVIGILLNKQKRRKGMLPIVRKESHEYIDQMDEIMTPNFTHAGSMIQLFNLPKDMKIPFEELEIEAKMIGEGEFGIVYRAKYQEKSVAVKVLKGLSGTYEVRQIVEEIMKMKDFSHPNILSLIGVSIDHHFSPCIIMPFMWNGSLNYFLQKEENKDKYFFPLESVGKGSEVDTAAGKLLDMCLQIAKGMSYLNSEKIIHRDLAARNCMVSIHNVIKVADFGLSVTLPEGKEYYRLSDSRKEKLPWKWMAIEILTEGKFSEASDVWSFGVTCWEVFNAGGKPYPGIGNRDIMIEIQNGYRMDKPPNLACKQSIFQMMQSCWENDPADRPNFSVLVTQLSSLLQEIKEYLPLLGTQPISNDNSDIQKSSKEQVNVTDSDLEKV